ncbi:MAG: hypothetical protein ACQEW0_18780, partial [Pseudomonadota bacterium]
AVPVQCGIAPVNVLENVLEKGEVEMECSLQCQLKHRPQVDAQQCRVTWREKCIAGDSFVESVMPYAI